MLDSHSASTDANVSDDPEVDKAEYSETARGVSRECSDIARPPTGDVIGHRPTHSSPAGGDTGGGTGPGPGLSSAAWREAVGSGWAGMGEEARRERRCWFRGELANPGDDASTCTDTVPAVSLCILRVSLAAASALLGTLPFASLIHCRNAPTGQHCVYCTVFFFRTHTKEGHEARTLNVHDRDRLMQRVHDGDRAAAPLSGSPVLPRDMASQETRDRRHSSQLEYCMRRVTAPCMLRLMCTYGV
jgi:hypothetical protein